MNFKKTSFVTALTLLLVITSFVTVNANTTNYDFCSNIKGIQKTIPEGYTPNIIDGKNDGTCEKVGESISNKQIIKILSPNGDEDFNSGEKISYSWEQKNNSKKLEVSLIDTEGKSVYLVKRYDGRGTNKKIITKQATAKIIPGEYRLQICDLESGPNSGICDVSDETFTLNGEGGVVVDDAEKKDQAITIISPNEGEEFKANTKIPFSWKQTKNSKKIEVSLISSDNKVMFSKKTYEGWGLNSKVIDANSTTYIPAGLYTLKICDTSTTNSICDTSDQPLKIVSTIVNSTTTSNSSIKVKLPNGSEKINITNTEPYLTVNWESKNIKGDVGVGISFEDGYVCSLGKTAAVIGAFTAKLDTNYVCDGITKKLSSGKKYKIDVYSIENNTIKDKSDNYFEINFTTNRTSIEEIILATPVTSVVPKMPKISTKETRTETNDSLNQIKNNNKITTPSVVTPKVLKITVPTTTKVTTPPIAPPSTSKVVPMYLPDACTNIAGMQHDIPEGYTNVGVSKSGTCEKIPVKVQEKKAKAPATVKVCEILKTEKVKNKDVSSWSEVKCQGDAFVNAAKKDKRIIEKKAPVAKTSSFETLFQTTTDLELGNTNELVKKLQQYLNSNGFIVNKKEGMSGSIGNESDYFGSKTKEALIRYQTTKGIIPAQGYYGPQTRSLMGI